MIKTERAIFAAGCFWGVEYHFQRMPGVLHTQVGYTGGHLENPIYAAVCHGDTGHREAVAVEFDPAKTNFHEVAKLFFEIHNLEQIGGQGPDHGEQYTSAIYVTTPAQKKIAAELIAELESKVLKVVTEVLPARKFWPAEQHHQKYYDKTGRQPYCHTRVKRF